MRFLDLEFIRVFKYISRAMIFRKSLKPHSLLLLPRQGKHQKCSSFVSKRFKLFIMYYSIISWEDLNYDFNFDLFSYDWIFIITIIVHLIYKKLLRLKGSMHDIWSEMYPHIYLPVCLLHLVAEILDKSKILNTRW